MLARPDLGDVVGGKDDLTRPPLTILIANPRGFCAGVDRAIEIVERALERFGRPVFVRHQIVHNATVVADLEAKGAVFVAELDAVPDGVPVVFSAHGVAKAVTNEAGRRRLMAIDATCPLVTKVHREAERHHAAGRGVIVIGHAGHPEVDGTRGQLPDDATYLVETEADVERLAPADPARLAYVTQTTLSVDDTARIVAALKRRFPAIEGPRREDICYATSNRQEAVKAIAPRVDALLVVGSPRSSNANRLVDVARDHGCGNARLIETAAAIDWDDLSDVRVLGLTSGASTPESLVEEVLAAARLRRAVTVEPVTVAREDVVFRLPPTLDPARAAHPPA